MSNVFIGKLGVPQEKVRRRNPVTNHLVQSDFGLGLGQGPIQSWYKVATITKKGSRSLSDSRIVSRVILLIRLVPKNLKIVQDIQDLCNQNEKQGITHHKKNPQLPISFMYLNRAFQRKTIWCCPTLKSSSRDSWHIQISVKFWI